MRTSALPTTALLLLTLTATASAAGPKASISGGADTSGHQYEWTVSNHFRSPIVGVEIPHHHAGFFVAPTGWNTDDSTGLANAAGSAGIGWGIARAPARGKGIARGKSASFAMQITHSGAKRGPGTVRIKFADGSETLVSGVEVPQPSALGDKYMSLIGLGAIFSALIAWRAIRGKKSSSPPS